MTSLERTQRSIRNQTVDRIPHFPIPGSTRPSRRFSATSWNPSWRCFWKPWDRTGNTSLLAHSLTGERKYLDWFEKILAWSLRHFPDRQHGEWLGYLHRDGGLALDLKGNLFKGPFHLPRQQLFCHLLLEEMLDGSA